jgi:hypothetical protein
VARGAPMVLGSRGACAGQGGGWAGVRVGSSSSAGACVRRPVQGDRQRVRSPASVTCRCAPWPGWSPTLRLGWSTRPRFRRGTHCCGRRSPRRCGPGGYPARLCLGHRRPRGPLLHPFDGSQVDPWEVLAVLPLPPPEYRGRGTASDRTGSGRRMTARRAPPRRGSRPPVEVPEGGKTLVEVAGLAPALAGHDVREVLQRDRQRRSSGGCQAAGRLRRAQPVPRQRLRPPSCPRQVEVSAVTGQ